MERHDLGPRLFVLGKRVHECMIGVSLLAILGALLAADVLEAGKATGLLAALGVWLVAKDWRDLVPSRRDTARWSLGLHRLTPPLLPPRPRGGWLPPFAATFAGFTALINLDSALAPDIRVRGHLLSMLLPDELRPLSHALAIPLSAALLLVAFFLGRRRRRAWQAAVGLLVGLAALNLLKGLSYEEALLSVGAIGLLVYGRRAFVVPSSRDGLRASALVAAATAGGALALAAVATWVALPGTASLSLVVHETTDLLLWQPGPVQFHDDLGHLPIGIGLVSLGAGLTALWLLCRPLAAPRALPGAPDRVLARDLVQRHGHDTLAYFKLRADKHYLFSPDARAFLGYRVENGVLVISGDPVGHPDSLRPLLRETAAFARRHGLRLAALGASGPMLPLYADAGMRSMYLGDEAILDTVGFSLEGRRMRGIRQAVARVERAGYRAELHYLDEVDRGLLAELEHVSQAALGGERERGFTMAMDCLGGEHAPDGFVVLARDEDGEVGGFLHFVPVFGRPAASLAFMRRRKDTPNGLTDFLVVRSLALLRGQGIEEISLNFALFARYLREPAGRRQLLMAAVLRFGGRWSQLESLYRFNAKFRPRWEPRYLTYENAFSLVPTAVASLWVEGQLPKPGLARRQPKTEGVTPAVLDERNPSRG